MKTRSIVATTHRRSAFTIVLLLLLFVSAGESVAASIGEQLRKAAERGDFAGARARLEHGTDGNLKPIEGECLIPVFVYFLDPGTLKLPNFNQMKCSEVFCVKRIQQPFDGGAGTFYRDPLNRGWLGLRFCAKLRLAEKEKGTYRFRIVTPHAARLIVGSQIVVAGEASELLNKSVEVSLEAGLHELFLDYFHGKGPTALQLFITPPGEEERVFQAE